MKRYVRAALTTTLLCATAGTLALMGAISAQAQMGAPAPSATPARPASTPSSSSSSDQKVSKAVGKPLSDASTAFKANDFPSALANIKLAQAVADRTPFDDYKINQFLAAVSINLKDYDTATTATEAAADSPAMPDGDKASNYHNAFILASNAKQYQKAIVYGQDLAAVAPLDDKSNVQMAIDYYELKDTANAALFAQKAIDAEKAAGQTPDANALRIVMSGQVGQNDQAGAEKTLEAIVLADPDSAADSWRQLVDVALSTKGLKDIDAMFMFRLKLLAGAMTAADDYTTLGGVAEQLGYPTEAVEVLQKGIASGKLSAAQAAELNARARKDAAMDERMLSSIAAAAEKSKTGEQDVKLGEDYWGYGRYSDAEAAARSAVAKGGMKDPGEGPLLLGATLVAQGKYNDGIQALAQVSGTPAKLKVAHLWTLYAQAKLKSAPAAPPPAPAH